MAVKNIIAESWPIVASADGRKHSGSPAGNAVSGGNAALGWLAPDGIAVGNRLVVTTDGSKTLHFPKNSRFTGFSQTSYPEYSQWEKGQTQFDLMLARGSAANGNTRPVFRNFPRGQGQSVDCFAGNSVDGWSAVGAWYKFPKGATEVFISFCMHVPSTSVMPHNVPGGVYPPGTWPPDSMWKMSWLQHEGCDDGHIDLCIPSYVSLNRLSIGGNGVHDHPFGTVCHPVTAEEPLWHRFDHWVRVSALIKFGHPDPITDNGYMWFEAMNGAQPASRNTWGGVEAANGVSGVGTIMASARSYVPRRFGGIKIPGWSDGQTGVKQCEMFHTDFYCSYGDNGDHAAARVEIGNAATWGACTKRALCVPVRRLNDRAVLYTIERGDVDLTGDSWLYSVDGLNQRELVGQLT